MHFFIDEDLPRSVGEVLRKRGHEITDVRDTDLRGAEDSKIAAYVKKEKFCLVTGDFDVLKKLPGQLAIVEQDRVRIRGNL